MLKVKLSKEDHAKLPADIQKEYQVQADGSFELDHDGLKQADLDTVLKARDNEKALKQKAKDELKTLQESYEELEKEKVKTTDDVKAVETKLTNKHKTELEKVNTRIATLRGEQEKALVQQAATKLASEVFKSDALTVGMPHVERRLKVQWGEDDKADVAELVYIDAKGEASTLDKVKQEILTSPDFKSIVRGTGASGAGSGPSGGAVLPLGGSPPFQSSQGSDNTRRGPPSREETAARVKAQSGS